MKKRIDLLEGEWDVLYMNCEEVENVNFEGRYREKVK
jgi:hypothetical protein